jgi:hypothetical protein
MTGSALIQIAISLVFIYTLFSLLCSVFNEWVARIANLRPKILKFEIDQMLGPSLARKLNAHPLITGLIDSDHCKYPHYIPPLTFALALIDLTIEFTEAEKPGFPGKARIKVSEDKGRVLAESLLRHTSNLEALQERVINWFELSMEQASGQYKRQVQIVIAVFAIIITVAFNIDTVAIFQSLYQQLASGANASVFPIGDAGDTRRHVFTHLPGWLITAAALSLGAPFWFDLLNKLVNLRQTGLPPNADSKSRSQP